MNKAEAAALVVAYDLAHYNIKVSLLVLRSTSDTRYVRRSGAILSRLLVVLTLVLFGLPQGHAAGMAANAGPAVQSQVEQVLGVPATQRHLARVRLLEASHGLRS